MLTSLENAIALINEGKVLHIAADESLLEKLPKGRWIGGTTPYFITEAGGVICKDKLYVDEIACCEECKVAVYDQNTILNMADDAYDNEICFVILPFASDVAACFAKEGPNTASLFMVPTVGWISGYDLSIQGAAKVYDGFSGAVYTNQAVALHVKLPEGKIATLGIVNIFEPDANSPVIEFEQDALSVRECLIDGQKVLLADYLSQKGINTELPLVSDYNGTLVNVSIKGVRDDRTVDFYAPVFAGCRYRFARFIPDYAATFTDKLKDLQGIAPAFSCNCILNFLYGNLEGKSTPPFAGPVTFGEVAYQLLNQTLVYAQILNA